MQSTSNLFLQRGLFWWSKQRIPRNCFAPSDCATGTVTIRSDGRAVLELDEVMPGESSGFAALANPAGRPREAIQGHLKDGSSILLFSVVGDGGSLRSRGISFQRFISHGTLVSQSPLKPKTESRLIKRITFKLENLNEWLLIGGIKWELYTCLTQSAGWGRFFPSAERTHVEALRQPL